MTRPRWSRRLRQVGAALAVAAGLLCAPSVAWAECGDYVTVAGRSAAEPHQPPPCDGPTCTGRPSTPAPPLTVPAVDSTRGHECAAAAAGPPANPDPPAVGRRPPGSTLARPVHVPRTIFDPPRGR